MANYNRDIKNGMSQEKALERFNNYNATQQSKRPTEKNSLQQSNNEIVKTFTMFGSATMLQMNNVSQSWTNMVRDISNGKKPKQKDVRKLYLNLAVANVLFVAAGNIAKYFAGDDDDKDEVYHELLLAMIGLNLLYQIPMLGAVLKFGVGLATGDKTPISENINSFLQVAKDVQKGLKEDDVIKAARPLVEFAVGFKFNPFIAVGELATGNSDENSVYELFGISKSFRPSKNGGGDGVGVSMSDSDMRKYRPDIYERMNKYKRDNPIIEREKERKEKQRDLQNKMKERMFNR